MIGVNKYTISKQTGAKEQEQQSTSYLASYSPESLFDLSFYGKENGIKETEGSLYAESYQGPFSLALSLLPGSYSLELQGRVMLIST